MLTQMEHWKIQKLQEKFGSMRSQEALNLAIDAEYFTNACGPFDVAFPKFKKEQNEFEEYALLLEKQGK